LSTTPANSSHYPGLFIVFEGVEGSGKTTQINRLKDWLTTVQTAPVVQTREPGGTELGTQIRSLLLDAKNHDPIADRAELLLFAADRAQHIEQLVRPKLENGAIVLCDRFTTSTIAYQGYGRGLDVTMIQALNAIATAGIVPDLTIWLDLDPAVGLRRAHDRGVVNRMDSESLEFHRRVRQGYCSVAAELAQRGDQLLRIDASASIDAITHDLQTVIVRLVNNRRIDR
jgi:dTMP kinase